MGTNYLKKLYKKTASGAIQEWLIATDDTTIITTYGQRGGKMQTASDSVKSGKNLGRKNATDRATQAIAEAQAQWLKKKKAGYVESLKDAESGKVDSIIAGGILPMLAKVYQEHSKKIKGRVAVQPKLDGGRMLCTIGADGAVSLWTRTRKRIYSMQHIEEKMAAIAQKRGWKNMVLDGEAYNHSLKNDFEKLMSAFRKEEPTPEAQQLQYHVYDVVSELPFDKRIGPLSEIALFGGSIVQAVDTHFTNSEEHIMALNSRWVQMGFEGTMVRMLDRGYENKRSDQLLKLKDFLDAEYEIVGIEEGRGKLSGHAGCFTCQTKDGKKFGAKLVGELSFLKTVFENQDEYIGKLLTVKYQGLTSDGIPRFPVGMRLRGEEV